MSVDSALIVRKAGLPAAAELVAAIAETGVSLTFPADFTLDQNVGGWLPVTVDGAESGFHGRRQTLGTLILDVGAVDELLLDALQEHGADDKPGRLGAST